MPISRTRTLSSDALCRRIPQGPETVVSGQELVEDVEDGQAPPTGSLVDPKVIWVHFILGCSTLMAWNVIITAIPYFLKRLEGSGFENSFSPYLSTLLNISSFLSLAHATLTSKNNSPSRRIRLSIYWLVLLTALLAISTLFLLPSEIFVAFVLLNGAAQAAAASYLQAAVVTIASLWGPMAVQAMMTGQSAVAVAVSGVQVISAATSILGGLRSFAGDGSAEERSAFIFFTFSLVFLVASAGAHSWLTNLPSYKTVVGSLEQQVAKRGHHVSGFGESRPLISRGRSDTSGDRSQILQVVKINILYELAIGYVFVVTLSVYPPITTSVRPVNPEIHPLLFTSIHFFVFNTGDFLGRYACSFPVFLVWCRKCILGMSLARTLFIPLFLICNVQHPSPSNTPIPAPIINSDLMFMLILFIFAWTGGYLASLCMIAAPSIEHNSKLKGNVELVDIAGTMANFSLVAGLTLGSIISFAVESVVCRCNPFTS